LNLGLLNLGLLNLGLLNLGLLNLGLLNLDQTWRCKSLPLTLPPTVKTPVAKKTSGFRQLGIANWHSSSRPLLSWDGWSARLSTDGCTPRGYTWLAFSWASPPVSSS